MAVLKGYYDVTTYSSVQDAENHCESNGGGVVYFPPGTYQLSSTVVISLSAVQWLGAGAGASIIQGTTPNEIQPTMVETAADSGISNITIQGIGFVGNNYPPPSGSAPPTILFNGGEFNKVIECYFTLNEGRTVYFAGTTDGEVCRCRFYNLGYSGDAAATTEAVYADSTSLGIRVHDNYFDTCKFGAIALLGSACDASHNVITNASGVGIYLAGADTRVALNSISGMTLVTGAGRCSGIQASAAAEFVIIGNNISHGDGDGISIVNGWSYGILVGNNTWDNAIKSSTTVGDAGIALISDKSGENPPSDRGMIVVANNSFDDGAGVQTYGLHVNTNNGSSALDSVIMGNSLRSNVTQDIFEQNPVLQDDSNAIIGNTAWLDRQHTTAPFGTSNSTYTLLQSLSVAGGSMRQRCGIRITAAGSTSGQAGKKHIQLELGSTGTIFTFDSPGESAGTWQLLAFVINYENSAMSQIATAFLFYNGVLEPPYELSLSIDTTQAQLVSIYGMVGDSGDSITCDYLMVERC